MADAPRRATVGDEPAMSSIFVAWTAFQRRQVSMAPHCGCQTVFFPVARHAGRLAKAWTYLANAWRTWRCLRSARPGVVWVQLPQVPLLWVALLYRALSRSKVSVVADCHNAQLRPPWSRFPLALSSLRRADVVLVHNQAMLAQARALGWPMDHLRVLEDVPPVGKAQAPNGTARRLIARAKPWVVFPGSFAADEPIGEILAAARLAPEICFILTGRIETARRHGHVLDDLPANVVLPGFLPVDAFDDLLREADAVLGLTKVEGIQLSVCNEALGFGRPLVTSDTRLLREMFGAAAVLVDTASPASIAQGCRAALADAGRRSALSVALGQQRLAAWTCDQLAEVQRLLR
ncbi:MAG: glycosyltransferase family 4 protein [Burkholderiaceae bacterium]|nr:glycosyltransferase family 4 protein [Burkholderiaceae bacterium]